jgi:arsenate reductase (thioredoxin)
MVDRIYNVLFLCTGNTARSVLAEGILRKDGAGRFNSYSAGSMPKGVVNPFAVATLANRGYPADGYSSKRWDAFAGVDAPKMDFVFTVCDNAAGETCPIWPGRPITAHWGIADPAAVDGTDADKLAAFATAFDLLKARIDAFLAVDVTTRSSPSLQSQLDQVGRMAGATTPGSAANRSH